MPYRYYPEEKPCYPADTRDRYGFWNFIGDVVMTLITSGLWLIWIFVREMRRR